MRVSNWWSILLPRSSRRDMPWILAAWSERAERAAVTRLSKPDVVEAPEVVVWVFEQRATPSSRLIQVVSTENAWLKISDPCFWRVRAIDVPSAAGSRAITWNFSSSKRVTATWNPEAYSLWVRVVRKPWKASW